MLSLEANGRCYRLTFSRSLAEHIQRLRPELEIRKRTFRTGRMLAKGEMSRSGVYAIVDTRKFKTLRLSLIKDVAYLLRSNTRTVHEGWLV